MSNVEFSHKAFQNILKNLPVNQLLNISSQFTKKLKPSVFLSNGYDKKFLNEILKYQDECYILPNFIPNEPGISIVPKQRKSLMIVRLSNTKREFLKYYNSKKLFDLLELHSYQKGQGSKLMQLYLAIHEQLGIPGAVWCETEGMVQYYEKYGFINLGQLGDKKEFLLMLPKK